MHSPDGDHRRGFFRTSAVVTLAGALGNESLPDIQQGSTDDGLKDAVNHEVWVMNGFHLHALQARWQTMDPKCADAYASALHERFRLGSGSMTQEKWGIIFRRQDPIDRGCEKEKNELRTRAKIAKVLFETNLMHQPFEIYE